MTFIAFLCRRLSQSVSCRYSSLRAALTASAPVSSPHSPDGQPDEHGANDQAEQVGEKVGVHSSNYIQPFNKCKLLDVLDLERYGRKTGMTVPATRHTEASE